MLTPVKPGVTVTPLITVGDRLRSGYRFEAIPDGIAVDSPEHRGHRGHRGHRAHRGHHGMHRRGRVDVYVNHETGRVPFPWSATGGNTEGNAENDFDNSQLSKLTLDTRTGGVLRGSFAITSRLGYQRFCSNYLATWREGFTRKILLTNEETPDYVLRQENAWPPLPIGHPQEREAGLVVAYDVESGEQRPIHGMGRHNHENSVPVPGYHKPVVLSGDDTFTSGPLAAAGSEPAQPAQSQLFSYIANNTNQLMRDRGDLWAFVSDTPGVNDYYDVPPGSPMSITGRFIKVPRNIATGLNPDGSEIQAEDVGYPEPPSNGSWQLEPRWQQPPPVPGVDGPQWVLQHWSDLNDVFQFVRVEDIAYDKRPGMGNVVYIADSGRGRAPTQSLDTPFRSTNGRVWRMVLDRKHPTKVTSLTVFVEGDDKPVKSPDEIHQPDNLESTRNGILVTEDPGSSQQFAPGDSAGTTARLWHVPFAGVPEVVVRVDQSQDGGPTDVDGRPPGNWGAWESSGIVDASHAFGPDMFLIDVQAHTLWVERRPGEDNFAPPGPDFTYKREGGQLLLIRIPGG
jgi:hypothetical protein